MPLDAQRANFLANRNAAALAAEPWLAGLRRRLLACGGDEVVLQGSNIGVDATVTIGGEAMLAIAPAEEDTNFPEWAQDIGFKYTGITPPAPGLGATITTAATAGLPCPLSTLNGPD
jgi:hypothetical protein